MSNPYFTFKQFTVHHDRCAMKVGTDGVLLGAWTNVECSRKVLDIGTGTGLIALMLAQRCADCSICAIDVDSEAVIQAQENVALSPWKDRVEVLLQDVRTYQPDVFFDTIVSNPPYFVDSLKCFDVQRNTARHSDVLNMDDLFSKVALCLTTEGRFSIIYPANQIDSLIGMADKVGLYPSRCTMVVTSPGLPPKRVLLEFCRVKNMYPTDELIVELERHKYSEEYINLTKEFYLKF